MKLLGSEAAAGTCGKGTCGKVTGTGTGCVGDVGEVLTTRNGAIAGDCATGKGTGEKGTGRGTCGKGTGPGAGSKGTSSGTADGTARLAPSDFGRVLWAVLPLPLAMLLGLAVFAVALSSIPPAG